MAQSKVSYCINTYICSDTINPGHDALNCADCGAKLLVGDRYRLIEILNQDNPDPNKILVYRAFDSKSNAQVVLKISDSPRQEARKYIQREYDFLSIATSPITEISSENLFEWIPDEKNSFFKVYVLVIPWIDGQDSLSWIRDNKPISEINCIKWIKQILDYLDILSNLSFMHRDIKPENIIISPDKSVHLIDYGSVRRIDSEYISILEGTERTDSGNDVRRATRIFTFGYSPPEQLVGKAVIQSDFYALGKTIVYWVTGRLPNSYENISELQFDCSKISRTFIRFIEWLTAKNVGSRPLSSADIRLYLEERYERDLKAENRSSLSKIWHNPKFYVILLVISGFCISAWLGISQIIFSQGLEAFEKNQYERARAKFKIVLEFNRFHGKSYYYLGLDCYRHNDSVCAENNFKKALKWIWNPGAPLYQLGILSEDQGNIEKAREYYLSSISSYKRNPEAFNRLARLEIFQNQLDLAQSYVDRGLKFANDKDIKVRLLNQQGRIYFEREEWEKADQVLRSSNSISSTAESACLIPKIKKELGESQTIVDGLWVACFYAPSQYPEGDDYKDELLHRALPSLFTVE